MKTRKCMHTYEPPKAEILTIAPQCVLCVSAIEGLTDIESFQEDSEFLAFP